MRDRIVSDKYAEALLNTAKNRGIMEQVAAEIGMLNPLFAGKTPLRRFFEGPQITDTAKYDLAKRAFENQISPLLYHFIIILLRKHRMDHISDIFNEFLRLVDIERGIQEATVITAIPMDPSTQSRLQSRLEEVTQKKIRLHPKVDSKILGGVIVHIDNTLIDGSFRTQLLELKEDLLHVRVY